MVQGHKGAAPFLGGTQAGHIHKREIPPELQKEGLSFLDRSFERHFNERPYLDHRCYLFLTKTTRERARQQSNFSTLCRGRILPKELDHEAVVKFMESVEQFERIINDSGHITLRRLTDEEAGGHGYIFGTHREIYVPLNGVMSPVLKTWTSRRSR